ncbi:uncharacterized protein BXZ73DRAFT_90288 [Epithele typhae]|uniref:uncharacterized protein n=1 Tax=Epithele typhae TaxID=378194 RepID=UPI002007F47E|nr:uncharacterized protein BXZ73DRAFT_90288 [Epithele typhae]KAH9930465.1 hypothetical protein BXZ73DRAFT_90288 [Epithele typhae]
MSRPLTLHVSALNDAEYAAYTASLHDIVEQPPPAVDYDKLQLGVREARAWLRGRYPALTPASIDAILRLWSPDLAPADTMTAGQFFAALRLVYHVLGGREMDPALVFMQAHPKDVTSRSPSPHGTRSRIPSDNNPFHTNGTVSAKPPPPSLPPKPTNPFLNRRVSQDGPPPQSAPPGASTFPGMRPSLDGKVPPLPPRKPPVLPPPRHASLSANAMNMPRDPPPPVPAFPRSASSNNTSNTLIQQSLQATRIAQSLKKAEQRLEQERVMEVLKSSAVPPRRMRSTSPTKLTSSSASSTTSSTPSLHVRNTTVPSLPPRRNLSPPASTVGAGTVHSFEQVATASLTPFNKKRMTLPPGLPSPFPPEPPARRSFASPTVSPSRTPPRSLADLPNEPPPRHPDRKPSTYAASSVSADEGRFSTISGNARVGRSKSMHQASPPPVPPPPRRKRPESVQISPSGSPLDATHSPFADVVSPRREPSPGSPSHLMLSRHLSLTSHRSREREQQRDGKERGRDPSDSPLGSLQRTFTSLSLRAQPALDTARYKAEGAFSRRGFVPHHGAGAGPFRREGDVRRGLMGDADGVGDCASPGPDNDDADSSVDQDSVADGLDGRARNGAMGMSVEERARRWREGGVDVTVEEGSGGRRMVLERDELKWPAGDGWRPL